MKYSYIKFLAAGLLLTLSGCVVDSWYGYKIAGVITRDNGAPAGGVIVVPSIGPERLVGPPRSEGTQVTVLSVLSPKETGPILATVTSPDGRYERESLSGFVESAFSDPALRLENVFVYVWQDGWTEHRIPVGNLPQPLENRWTRSIHVPAIKISGYAERRS